MIGGALTRTTAWVGDQQHAVNAVALLRAAIGFVSVVYIVQGFPDRRFLFGSEGLFGQGQLAADLGGSGSWSVFAMISDGLAFDALYILGLLLAAAVAVGFGGRVVLGCFWVMMWSLYTANPALMDGGDNLVILLTLILMLTRCFDRVRLFPPLRVARNSVHGTISHNTGVLLIAAQMCLVYLMAGLYKVQGELWQDGTALYYVLQVPEFVLAGVTPLLLSQGWLLVVAAYATVLTSVFFTPMVFFRAGRPIAVAAMICFHVAIGVVMGLTSFALIMICADLVFVDHHVDRFRQRTGRATSDVLGRLRSIRVRS